MSDSSQNRFSQEMERLAALWRDDQEPSPLTSRWQRIKEAVSPLRRSPTATSDPHAPDFAEPLAPVADWMRLPR